jgi:hypothetical protein
MGNSDFILPSDPQAFARRLRQSLPMQLLDHLSRLVFRGSGKPFVYRNDAEQPLSTHPRGIVVFSVDFALAWAWQYSKKHHDDKVRIALRERSQIPVVLKVFERYGIPATWATVGHLALRSCDGDAAGHPHPEIPRCGYFEAGLRKFSEGDWFQHDPCSSFGRDPAWYAPDLVDSIVSARAGHELGCHSFSHSGCGRQFPAEVVSAELDASIAALQPFNVRPVSFVFPSGSEGKFDLLAAKGFKAVRAYPVRWAQVAMPVELAPGLMGIHASRCVESNDDDPHHEQWLHVLKAHVNSAIRNGMAAHFWFRPSLHQSQIEKILLPLVTYCAKQRDRGLLDVMTMGSLADLSLKAKALRDEKEEFTNTRNFPEYKAP